MSYLASCSTIQNNYPISLRIECTCTLVITLICYFVFFKESPTSDEGIGKNVITETRCTCGKNKKDPMNISCVASKCPCYQQKQSCSRKCRCYNCKNEHITTNQPNRNETVVNRAGCRCGSSTSEDPSQLSCRDGQRKSKCSCVRGGTGCSELCKCFNCANIFQARVSSATPSPQRKRQREIVSPYKRKKGTDFMEFQNVPVTSGPWRGLETLCLIVCQEVLLSNDISVNSSNLKLLYNFVAEYNSVKALSLIITVKSTAQVAAKMQHLRDYHTL